MYRRFGKVSSILAVAFGVALCLALCACSGSAASSSTATSASASTASAAASETSFAGKWVLYETTEGGKVINYDEADASTKALMDKNYIVLDDDGSMIISDDGNDIEGTWEVTGATTGTISAQGHVFEMVFDGDLVTITNPAGEKIVMRKA